MSFERDRQILELTGIRPDPRYFVPAAEKTELARGVQAGDADAAEALVATRLHWLHHTYADRRAPLHPRIAEVGLQDFLHIGGMAVIQAAEHIGRTTGDPVNVLHSRTPDRMRDIFDDGSLVLEPPRPLVALMNRGKLLPAAAPDGSVPLYTAAQEAEDARVPEHIELDAEVPETPSYDPNTDILFLEAARKVFDRLDERRRYIAESWFGLDRPEQKLEQIGEQLGITKARTAQLKDDAVRMLRTDPLIRLIGAERNYEMPQEEPAGPAGPPPPPWEPENNPLQQAWLDEIREKQERGDIAFVRGSLLTRPLPPEVERYLFWTHQDPYAYDRPSKKLHQALNNPHFRP